MKEIKFSCPFCQQSLEAPLEMAKMLVECPTCQNRITIPVATSSIGEQKVPLPQSNVNRETRPCPFCGEEILTVAIKCKHCSSNLKEQNQFSVPKSTLEVIGLLTLILPASAGIFAWIWLSKMPILFDPMSKLTFIATGTVLITSILIAIEASLVGAGSESDRGSKGRRRHGPITWFLFSILFWIFAFPLWMYYRSKYGLRNFLISSSFSMLLFVGVLSFLTVGFQEIQKHIESQIKFDYEQTQRELEKILSDMSPSPLQEKIRR